MIKKNKPMYVIYAKGQDDKGFKWYKTEDLLHGDYPTGWSADLNLIPTPRMFSLEYKAKYRGEETKITY